MLLCCFLARVKTFIIKELRSYGRMEAISLNALHCTSFEHLKKKDLSEKAKKPNKVIWKRGIDDTHSFD